MNGYGLQLRKKPVAGRPPLPPPAPGFGDEDDDDVEKEIARQAAMKRSKKEVRLYFMLFFYSPARKFLWIVEAEDPLCTYRLGDEFTVG